MLVLDLTMPEMNGLEVVRSVRECPLKPTYWSSPCTFSEELAREVLSCGALAYVLKSDADTDLLVAVDHVTASPALFHQPTRLVHEPEFSARLRPCRPRASFQALP